MADVIFWNATEMFGDRDHFAIRKRTTGVYVMKKWLEICNYQSEVIDFANIMEIDDLVKITMKLMTSKTLCIGVNMTFLGYGNTSQWLTRAFDIIQSHYPKVKLCIGGHNPFFPQIYPQFNPNPDITYLQGHGEELMIKYLDELSGRRVTRPNFDIQTKASTYPDSFRAFPGEVLDIEISRGCQFRCKFCRYPLLGKKKGTYIRHKEYILQEMQENYERWGTTRYRLTCDTFNEDNDKVIMFRDIQRELPFHLEWTGFLRMDLMQRNPDQLDQMVESGLRAGFFGVETLNHTSAKAIGKGWHATIQGLDYFKNINREFRDMDIRLTASMISGLPGDTWQSLDADVTWLLENEIQSGTYTPLSIVNDSTDKYPFPSDFDREAEKYGYTFPNEGRADTYDPTSWVKVSDGMTFHECKEFTADLNTRLQSEGREFRGLNNWKTFDYAGVMNVSITDAIKLGEIDRGQNRYDDEGVLASKSKLEKDQWEAVQVKSRTDIWNYIEQMMMI